MVSGDGKGSGKEENLVDVEESIKLRWLSGVLKVVTVVVMVFVV